MTPGWVSPGIGGLAGHRAGEMLLNSNMRKITRLLPLVPKRGVRRERAATPRFDMHDDGGVLQTIGTPNNRSLKFARFELERLTQSGQRRW
jgi:hypothetical protein